MHGIKTRLSTIVLAASFAASTLAASDNSHTTEKGGYAKYPTVNYGKGDQAKKIKRGEYLVKAGDCIACHTKPGGKPFAGGLPIKTPFGTIYSQNITPDQKTGIGSWSEKDFIRAMKEGVSPDGSYYFPVFPYLYFNNMTDADILDIKAYLDAIPAINEENRPVEMGIPFRWRFMQLGWRIMFFNFYRGEIESDPSKSAEWNRGKYLVDGPGHCSMCHTPINSLGAPKRKYYLSGGFVDGYYAPNISSSNLKNRTIEEIVNVFLHDNRLEGGKLSAPPMLEVNHDSLQYMNKDDLVSIATYIKSVVSKTPPAKAHGKVDLKTGETLYNKYCVACHTTGAGGAPKYGDKDAWKPLIDTGKESLYKNAISGIRGMPAKGNCIDCSDNEIHAAVDYLVFGAEGGASHAGATPAPVKLAKPTLKQGKKTYEKVCSLCHQEGKLNAPKIGDKKAWKPIIAQNMDVLFGHALKGYKGHPARGACTECSDVDIIAAVKYMVQESRSKGDYSLW